MRFEQTRLKFLRAFGTMLFPHYKFDWPQIGWWQDPDFASYLAAFGEVKSFNAGRRWTLYQLARLVADVAGDTAECGVYEGSSSFLICQATGGNGRTHHAFDSFEGLSSPVAADGNHWQKGHLSTPMERAQRNLRHFPHVDWHKGWIPDRFADIASRRFALVHIDVDLFEPTRDSMEFFYPRMNTGGIIVCDDYACTTCPGATKAADDYLRDKPEKMVSLPCGGGFLIKGTPTKPAESISADLFE